MILKKTFGLRSRKSFWGYDDISLLLFIQVTQSKEFKRLVRSGNGTKEECQEVWEQIVKKNSEANRDHTLDRYVQSIKAYGTLLQSHILIKIAITQLYFRVDNEDIKFLRRHRIKVDETSSENYKLSLQMAERKSDNLVTRMKMELSKVQELIDSKVQEKENGKNANFEELLAQVSVGIGFQVSDNVTLARYNEYKNIINKRSEKQKEKTKKTWQS